MPILHLNYETRYGDMASWWKGLKPLSVPLAMVLVVGLQGCDRTENLVGRAHPALPPDFALRFHVSGGVGSNDFLYKTSQYVVEPNRQLRMAFGAGVTADDYPNLVRRTISRAEFYDLSQHIDRHHLMSEPTSVGSEAPDVTVRYKVEITSHGRTHRYATSPAESPPSVQLLRLLIALHAGSPTGPLHRSNDARH